jgi:hypothetical protein
MLISNSLSSTTNITSNAAHVAPVSMSDKGVDICAFSSSSISIIMLLVPITMGPRPQ